MSTIPAVGDTYSYRVAITRATRTRDQEWPGNHGTVGEHRRGWFKDNTGKPYVALGCDLDNKGACPECFDQYETRTSAVAKVQHWMDNSVEVTLADGTTHMAVWPHGDACY